MCSIEENDETAIITVPEEKESDECGSCMKCGGPGCVVTRVQDSFCKACFQVYVVHKFRAAIGKSKLIRDGERVLVAFSGGQNSCALLHLIQDGLSKRAHKKLRFTPILIHVDESGIPGLSADEKEPTMNKVRELMATSTYPAYTTTLEASLSLGNNDTGSMFNEGTDDLSHPSSTFWEPSDHDARVESPAQEALRERLKTVVNNLASVSAREDFVRNLRTQLITHIARQMGLDKVLTANCSTRLAVRILADIAQGRGSQVALNTGFCDARRKDVLFLRPVRDLSSKELAMYNFLFNPDTAAVPIGLSTKGDPSTSVERLSESFVLGLQAGYQSTVSNIVRTSEKLGLPDFTNVPKCWCCQSPLDTLSGATSALRAVEVSLQLSQGQRSKTPNEVKAGPACSNGVVNGGGGEDGCCGEGDGSCHTKKVQTLNQEDIDFGLCYGCRLSLRGYKGEMDELPSYITKSAQTEKQRLKLRDEIADFLLEDDEEEDS